MVACLLHHAIDVKLFRLTVSLVMTKSFLIIASVVPTPCM